MSKMFHSFSCSGPLHVSDVIQKVFLKVDESGTEAAAFSGMNRILLAKAYGNNLVIFILQQLVRKLMAAALFVGTVLL